jgi:hypothetical protein
LKFLKCFYCVQKIFNSFGYLSNMLLMCTHKRNMPKINMSNMSPPLLRGDIGHFNHIGDFGDNPGSSHSRGVTLFETDPPREGVLRTVYPTLQGFFQVPHDGRNEQAFGRFRFLFVRNLINRFRFSFLLSLCLRCYQQVQLQDKSYSLSRDKVLSSRLIEAALQPRNDGHRHGHRGKCHKK